MTALPALTIIAWPSAAGSIPVGWSRVAGLDGYYLRGAPAGVDPDPLTPLGSATHTHDSFHTHDVGVHTHATAHATDNQVTNVANNVGGAATPATIDHSHSFAAMTAGAASAVDTSTSNSGTAAWLSTSTSPSTLSVIWLQGDGTTAIPPLALVHWDSQTLPVGFVRPGSAKSAYLQGAAGGADGGVTSGSNAHTHSGGIHHHGWTGSHWHTYTVTGSPATSGAASVAGDGTVSAGAGASSLNTHTHVVTSGNTVAAPSFAPSDDTASGTTRSQVNEPPYYTLATIQNGSTGELLPQNVIVCWANVLSIIPSGWTLCNGSSGTPDLRDQFVKGAHLLSDIGRTGGTATHAHFGPTHTHSVSHNTVFETGPETDGGSSATATGGNHMAASFHVHELQSSVDAQTTTAVEDIANFVSSLPPYVTMAYIQYTATGGTISVTTPAAASVQALPSFTAVWTLSGGRTQASYEVVIYQSDGVTVVYDSGSVTSSSQTALIPSGYLTNNGSWKFQVTATDSDGLISTSSQVSFTTAWTEPVAPTGLTVTAVGAS